MGSSVDDCVNILSGRNFGNYDEVWGDNVICREIHLVLTQIRPIVSLLVLLGQLCSLIEGVIGALPSRRTNRWDEMCG